MRHSLAVAGLLGLAACAGLAGRAARVTVTGTGRELSVSPRDPACVVEFYRTRPPDRAYEEVATFHVLARAARAADAQDAMRRKACDAGADAVIVTSEYVTQLENELRITASAVSYPELRERHRAAHRRRVEEWRKVIEATRRPAGVPSNYVLARTIREVFVTRTTREVLATGQYTKVSVPAGQLVWASEANWGHRLIVTGDAGEGSAAEEALDIAPAEALGPAADEPAPDAPRPAAPPRTEI